jgi:hypothetical protein
MSTPTCGAVREALSGYLEGDLDPRTAGEVRSHLEGCPACRSELELLRLTVGALRSLPDLPPPAGILAGVRARLRPEPWHRRLLSGRQWLLGVPVGAVATLLVVIGVALFQARYPGIERVVTPAVPGKKGAPTGDEVPPPTPPVPPAVPSAPPAPKGAPTPFSSGKIVQRPEASPKRLTAAPQARPDRATSTGLEIPRAPAPAAAPALEPRVTALQPSPPAEPLVSREESTATSRFVVPAPEPQPEAAGDIAAAGRPDALQGSPDRRTVAPDAREKRPQAVSPLQNQYDVAPTAASPGLESGITPRRGFPVPMQKLTGKGAATGFAPVGAPLDAATSTAPGTIGPGPLAKSSAPSPARSAPVVDTRREAAAAPPLGAVCLLSPDGGTIGEFSGFLKRMGAKDVWIRALEPRELRDAAAPHRERLALLPEPEHGWSVSFRIPPQALAGLFDALAKRPGLRLLVEPAGLRAGDRTAESLELRITVLK